MDERVVNQPVDAAVAPSPVVVDEGARRTGPPWHRRWELLLVIAIVLAAHLPRLSAVPICGEESRWATAARGMLESGDWIVPRQQGQVFPDRPPLGMWPIAALGALRGEVDAVAIRLPSVVAVALSAVAVFAYGSMFLSRLGAALAALLYPTMGQVLQLGSLGESDAQFALYVSASLLVWHAGYVKGFSATWVWAAGYALAAAGALVKGLQAPVYFVAATSAWLVLQRDWRYLFSWRHGVGFLAFAAVLGAWQIPYILATDLATAASMWTSGPAKRFVLDGLLGHVASYPLETFVCLLPWSPLLGMYASRRWRSSLAIERPHVGFLATACLVCYPTLWLAADARGRYFMCLYPCIALLVAVVVDRLVQCRNALPQDRFWRRYNWAMAAVVLLSGLAVVLASTGRFPRLLEVAQPAAAAAVFGTVAVAVAAVLFCSAYRTSAASVTAAMGALILFLVFGSKLVVTNATIAGANDLAESVVRVKERLPADCRLVSFTATNHRFDHHYGQAIEELPWPNSAADVPADVEYFCFVRRPGDTPQRRLAGRVWDQYTTSGTLPFAWEEVATVSMARTKDEEISAAVVVGRVVRRRGRLVAGETPAVTQR